MSITLFALNSSFSHTNLAVRYLASALDDAGYDCCILERNIKDKRKTVLHDLVCAPSDIYGLSIYIWNRNEMLSYARELKKLKPSCHIIAGGPEISFEDDTFFEQHPYIDTIISGEGEEYISTICYNITDYHHKVVKAECSSKFIDAGILYDKYPNEGSILYYESSRGCPHRCSYCLSSLSGKVRAKSAEQTLKELKSFELLDKKPKIIKFIDRSFNYDIERAKRIWTGLLSKEYTLNYHFEITADTLDEEAFNILSKMPKGKIQFEAGIQSTNPKTLNSVRRKSDHKKIIDNLTRLKGFKNIHIHADLIAGLPYEDINSFKSSFDESIYCCDKLQVGFLKLLKGSSLREKAEEHEYIYEDDVPYKILSTRYMDYKELYELEKIADTVDRFYSSDNFRNTLDHIISKCSSPFEFFRALTDSLDKPIDKLSQHECRLRLIEMIKQDDIAMSMLALDTLIWENKRPPEILSRYYKMISKGIINSLNENFKGYNMDNYNIYTLDNDNRYYYAIDSTKHILIKVKRCT